MKKKILMLLFIMASSCVFLESVFATTLETNRSSPDEQELYAPKPFQEGSNVFVPMDILTSEVNWRVSSDLSKINADAEIKFRVFDTGFPFLLLNEKSRLSIDGLNVVIRKMTGANFQESQYFALIKKFSPGRVYKAKLNYTFTSDQQQMTNFLPLQYYDHKLVEQGIPANAFFDRFPLTLNISIDGNREFQVFANGRISSKEKNSYQIKFPRTFTSISFFIDIVAKNQIVAVERNLKSNDGRTIKAQIYATKEEVAKKWVPTFAGIVEYKFAELEGLFGTFPQDTLILKISDKDVGGGSYAGAMVLSSDYMEDMSHEIGHSWFLHSVTPARGEDAWIYEGFGNWAHLYRTGFSQDKNLEDAIVLGKSEYKIWSTSEMFPKDNLRNPHQTGSMILASIDQTLKASGKEELKGGLVPILKVIAQERKHRTMSTLDLKNLIEKHSGLDMTELFDYYIK